MTEQIDAIKQKNEINHSALPWEVVTRGHSEGYCDVDAADGTTVVSNVGLDNAKLIVQRVNESPYVLISTADLDRVSMQVVS
ncbi:MAG: hypothetical protein ACTS9Y_00065 [Methylophilus sp.]|uniref:hypothetical protein n=1 Tax=Methylophilus sp. TaxID=29541 RepID=UPI003FA019B7